MTDNSKQYDGLGVAIEPGDIIYHAPQKGTGGIAQVVAVFPSGRITVKTAVMVNVYAYELGAPQVEVARRLPKKDVGGTLITEVVKGAYGGNNWRYVYEDVQVMEDDRTVVGHRWVWVKSQCAEYSRLVLRKNSTGAMTSALYEAVWINWDAEVPFAD